MRAFFATKTARHHNPPRQFQFLRHKTMENTNNSCEAAAAGNKQTADAAASGAGAVTSSSKTPKKRSQKRKPFTIDPDEIEAPSYERKTERGGYAHTSKSKLRISQANKGNIPWNKGKNRSEDVKARIREGVQRRNRKILLEKLAKLGMTEEEYAKKQKEIKYLRERLRRARLKKNVEEASGHDKKLQAMIKSTTIAKDKTKSNEKDNGKDNEKDNEKDNSKGTKTKKKEANSKSKSKASKSKAKKRKGSKAEEAVTTTEQSKKDVTMSIIEGPKLTLSQTATGEFVVVEIKDCSAENGVAMACDEVKNTDATKAEHTIDDDINMKDKNLKKNDAVGAQEVTEIDLTTTEPELDSIPKTNDENERKEQGKEGEKEEQGKGEKEKQGAGTTYASQLFTKYINWTPHPLDSKDNPNCYGTCPDGGPGGLICCDHCTSTYVEFLSRTSMDIDEQKTLNIRNEIHELLDFMDESRSELDDSHRDARKKPLPDLIIKPGEQQKRSIPTRSKKAGNVLDHDGLNEWSITNATDIGPNPVHFASI